MYHDSLALVLDDVTRPSHLVSAAKAEEHELIGWVYRVLLLRCGRVELALGRHGCSSMEVGRVVYAAVVAIPLA